MSCLLKKDQKSNVQVTNNFNLGEMEFYDKLPPNLVANATEVLKNLQVLRDELKKPITIISGYRSVERNEEVGGAKKSQHMEGNAVDVKVSGMSPRDVAAVVERLIKEGKMKQGGLGIYPRENGWIHYDTRGTKSRWEG